VTDEYDDGLADDSPDSRLPTGREMRVIGWHELQRKLGGRSTSSVRRDELAGKFPRRVRLGVGPHGQIAWFEHEIDRYLMSLARGVRHD